MKIINKFLALLVLQLYAMSPAVSASIGPFFVSIDPSLLLSNPGITQEINLFNTMGNTYVANKPWQQVGTVSLGVGLRAYQKNNLQINASLRYLPIDNLALNGQIWQLKSPVFNDLAYRYQVKSNLLLVDTIISWTGHRIQPGLILGLGMSRNTTDRFRESPLVASATPSLQVADGIRSTQTAYELGAVLDYSLDKAVAELAYRYINAGKGYLAPFTLQNTLDRLSTGTLNYHVVSIGIRAYYEL